MGRKRIYLQAFSQLPVNFDDSSLELQLLPPSRKQYFLAQLVAMGTSDLWPSSIVLIQLRKWQRTETLGFGSGWNKEPTGSRRRGITRRILV
jgi:hypothetical protein